jgi:hypothetical protein
MITIARSYTRRSLATAFARPLIAAKATAGSRRDDIEVTFAATSGGKRDRAAYLLAGSRNGAGVPSGAGMRKVSRTIDTMT